MAIIEVNHVTKEFQLGHLRSLKEAAIEALWRLRGRPVPPRDAFKALDDVNFQVEPGEVVGIIGQNGAGKSTMLKLLAGISRPTHGSIAVRGRVAPLIEVGAGLVPDLSGRENIYVNGAILGLKRAEIARKFDEIVAFAELEEFIDTPIKRYSSGMQVRLGFSIATVVDADILIVDEVLAVGDLAFQRKSFDRMDELIRRQHKTVLLVSHNIRQVERICSRVVLLDHGQLLRDGNPKEVCNLFYERSDEKVRRNIEARGRSGRRQEVGSNDVELLRTEILDASGRATTSVEHLGEFSVVFHLRTRADIERPTFGFGFHTADFVYIASQDTRHALKLPKILRGDFRVRCKIHNFPLLPGVYSIRFSLASGEIVIFYAESITHFATRSDALSLADAKESGFVAMDVEWDCEELRPPSCSDTLAIGSQQH